MSIQIRIQQLQQVPKLAGIVRSSAFFRVAKYLLVRATVTLVTIFFGVFVTVLCANQGGQIDSTVYGEVELQVDNYFFTHSFNGQTMEQVEAQMDVLRVELQEAAGLNLPYWPRQIRWTIKAMLLDWQGYIGLTVPSGSAYPSRTVKDMILTDMPHTLMLVAAAYTLLFLLGLPLALYLFRHQGSRLDRLVTLLAPLSSIPSWVLCLLFILIFSVGLRLLPPGGMYDTTGPSNLFDRILMVARHMILPVIAILFSLLWQYVYIWRTFFLLFADEDYVELARAKGLPQETIERQYILRPSLPYIMTNFGLMLVGFWQMSIALEKVLDWPGIGRLYILSLPSFFGEKFDPGSMPITLGIVVIFAYILGITVLMLDVGYSLVDPRVRLGDQTQTAQASVARPARRFWERRPTQSSGKEVWSRRDAPAPKNGGVLPVEQISLKERIKAIQTALDPLKSVMRELLRFPSAIFGMVVILILIIGSAYAVIAFPYTQIGEYWYTKNLTGKTETPKLALPEWVNRFRTSKLPLSLILNSATDKQVGKISAPASDGNEITLTYSIPYSYGEFPSNVVIYYDTTYTSKPPFLFITWITPDGREFELGRATASANGYFDISHDLSVLRLLSKNSHWRNWFVAEGNYTTPPVNLLFADPLADQPSVLPGTYQLRIQASTFEKDSHFDAEFVMLGQVYGMAGTDYMGRDLLLPLLWGMPFALVFGLLGACVTTFLSMVVAASGVWLGGWVDSLIQQLVEANMILPVIAIGVLVYSYLNISIWVFLSIVVLLNVFASPTKSFRAALLQVKDAPYVEAARTYGASNSRIIFNYLIPRIVPILIPQLVTLIPSYVFLEATLGIFNVHSEYPTWGRVIYEALRHGAYYGSNFWVLEPLSLLLLTGLAFAMLGFSLERILNPRIREV